ncbi:hypothetical protein [Streptomyces durmitorensis]|nr:hypothetical protein [Streptomyces durmitorensis]
MPDRVCTGLLMDLRVSKAAPRTVQVKYGQCPFTERWSGSGECRA